MHTYTVYHLYILVIAKFHWYICVHLVAVLKQKLYQNFVFYFLNRGSTVLGKSIMYGWLWKKPKMILKKTKVSLTVGGIQTIPYSEP